MSNALFTRRKEFKKKGHSVVRSHYLALVFLMAVMSLFGTEFRVSLSGWGKNPLAIMDTDPQENDPGNRLSDEMVISPSQVISDIGRGDVAGGTEKAEEQARALMEKFAGSRALGLTNGVLAQMVNTVFSGRLFAHLGQTIRTVTHSRQATAVIFTIGAFLCYALFFFLLKNVYSAVIRRAYLVARTYHDLSLEDVTWFVVVRKWIAACRAMLVMYVFQILWSFTIIGGIIKNYSYWAVPYIVAENPALSAKEAITLSRKMMYGHKLELFKLQMTMLGWAVLSYVTAGISDLAYGNAYKLAVYTEYYAELRREYLADHTDAGNLLNDSALFECPDRITLAEAYFDVVEEITDIQEHKFEPSGWRKRIADWFGVWLYSIAKKKEYDLQQERKLAVRHERHCMKGLAYPQRLSPLWKDRRSDRKGQFDFVCNYTVWTLILLFIFFCFVGWSWEVVLHLMQTGQFANRGTLHGPWLPIYGSGGVVVLVLCSRFRKNPVAEFFTAIVLCGAIEYLSAWGLETKYNQRWWSYDGYFLNLHGRICAEGLLVFGVGCCVVVYLVAPAFDHMLGKIRQKALIAVCLVLGLTFTADAVYSQVHPNMAEGAVESQITATDSGMS